MLHNDGASSQMKKVSILKLQTYKMEREALWLASR
jgi:hypothetical protein